MSSGGSETPGTEGAGQRSLPEGFAERLRELITELETAEHQDTERVGTGEIELKISESEALWYVAYRTVEQ